MFAQNQPYPTFDRLWLDVETEHNSIKSIKYLKACHEKFLVERLNWDRAIANYQLLCICRPQHKVKQLLDAAVDVLYKQIYSAKLQVYHISELKGFSNCFLSLITFRHESQKTI